MCDSKELETVVRALCFVEDAFRSICFVSLCQTIQPEHACSSAREWNEILDLSIRLHEAGHLPIDDVIEESHSLQEFLFLYQNFCSTNGLMPVDWVLKKIIRHVLFFKQMSNYIEIGYDSLFGFSVYWKPKSIVSDVFLEWEIYEEPPHIIIPFEFLSQNPQFGLYHPLTVRFWAHMESEDNEGEIMLGLMNMFNSACPGCQNVEMNRCMQKNQVPEYPLGYLRATVRPPTLNYGVELAFAYQRDWMKKSEFACKICSREPACPKWILNPKRFLELVDEFCERNSKCASAFEDVMEVLVFRMEEQFQREIGNVSFDINVSRSACTMLINFILNCFPLEIGSMIPALLVGRVLRLLSSTGSILDLQDFNSVVPQTSSLHKFHLLFRTSGCFNNCKSEEIRDLMDAISSRTTIDMEAKGDSDWMESVLRKMIHYNDGDSIMSQNVLRSAVAALFSNSCSGNLMAIDLVFLMFRLVSSLPFRALHANWHTFRHLHSTIFRSKFQSIFMFRTVGLQGSEVFPHSGDDLYYFLHDLAKRFKFKLLSSDVVKMFGGNIAFLLSKIRDCTASNILKLRFQEVLTNEEVVRSHFESFYNGLLQNPSFFEVEDNEDDLCDFIYWCLGNKNIVGDEWIEKLSSPSIDIQHALGHHPKSPLNFWTVLVYICDVKMDTNVVLGGVRYDVLDFTKEFVLPIVDRLMLSVEDDFCVYDVEEILFVTHVVYLLTDYGNLQLSDSIMNSSLMQQLVELFCKWIHSRQLSSFVESLCEIYRTSLTSHFCKVFFDSY